MGAIQDLIRKGKSEKPDGDRLDRVGDIVDLVIGTIPKSRVDAAGAKTSEFWLTIGLMAAGFAQMFAGQGAWLGYVGAGAAVLYKVLRFILKLKRSSSLAEVERLTGNLKEAYMEIDDLLGDLKEQEDNPENEGTFGPIPEKPELR